MIDLGLSRFRGQLGFRGFKGCSRTLIRRVIDSEISEGLGFQV
jgi:hypothetical protein